MLCERACDRKTASTAPSMKLLDVIVTGDTTAGVLPVTKKLKMNKHEQYFYWYYSCRCYSLEKAEGRKS